MTRNNVARVELLPAQRHAMILDQLRKQTAASVQELAERLGASISTVRRDLLTLTDQGYLERTHGGAIIRRLPGARFEPSASIAAEMFKAEKEAIARLAAMRVEPGQSVIFDASSTVRAAARHVAASARSITAVTNDLGSAALLSGVEGIHTIVTGGAVRPGTGTLMGEPARAFLAGINADIAFIGVHTVSGSVFTETSLEVAAIKRSMAASARRVIVLADSSKFGPPSFCEICGASDVDEIITDPGASEDQLNEIRASGAVCTIAPLPEAEA